MPSDPTTSVITENGSASRMRRARGIEVPSPLRPAAMSSVTNPAPSPKNESTPKSGMNNDTAMTSTAPMITPNPSATRRGPLPPNAATAAPASSRVPTSTDTMAIT